MLEVKNISSGYGKKQVLFDVSLQVNKGEVVLLTGGNGSGKSTLLKCIFNLLPCWSGEIFFDGERINDFESFKLLKKGIVYIPQKDFYFENLSVDQNLRISGNKIPKKVLIERISMIYEKTELQKFKNHKPFYLSGGERKLLGFSMGLIHNPKLILYDEPFAGIDNKTTKIIIELFRNLINNNKICVLFVEHKDTARGLHNRNLVLELGSIKKQK